jgi:hypothetical protein
LDNAGTNRINSATPEMAGIGALCIYAILPAINNTREYSSVNYSISALTRKPQNYKFEACNVRQGTE